MKRCGNMWKDLERHKKDVGRLGITWKDVERHGKTWKDVKRCGKT